MRKVSIFIAGLLIGFLVVTQYLSYQKNIQTITRDTNLSYVKQLNFLVSENSKLKSELNTLNSDLSKMRSNADAQKLLEQDIHNYELLSGQLSVTGQGIALTIETPLESFWLVDIINELFVAGAEAVTLNGNRFTAYTGIVSQGEKEGTLYINNETKIDPPYVLKAIGNQDTLKEYLNQSGGILYRLKEAKPAVSSTIKLEKNDSLIIPSSQ